MRYSRRGKTFSPFKDIAHISNKSCSRPLSRRVSDFAVERSFAKSVEAVKEHYGFEIPCYIINRELETVAKEAKAFNTQVPKNIQPAETLISEVDGSMIPIIEFPESNKTKNSTNSQNSELKTDRRKLRKCLWKEIRVSTVSNPKLDQTYYGVTLGEAMVVGCMMYESCVFQGLTETTHVHAVSDGAAWIADQYQSQFGTQCEFLLDYYHACEYLSLAIQHSRIDESKIKHWLTTQKSLLKESKSAEVIKNLKALIPKDLILENQYIINTSINYLENRKDQLDYKTAIDKDLPIGSGEVESAHRHIIQQRLKIAGAWWGLEKAEIIAQLRAMRANGYWGEFWQEKAVA